MFFCAHTGYKHVKYFGEHNEYRGTRAVNGAGIGKRDRLQKAKRQIILCKGQYHHTPLDCAALLTTRLKNAFLFSVSLSSLFPPERPFLRAFSHSGESIYLDSALIGLKGIRLCFSSASNVESPLKSLSLYLIGPLFSRGKVAK